MTVLHNLQSMTLVGRDKMPINITKLTLHTIIIITLMIMMRIQNCTGTVTESTETIFVW